MNISELSDKEKELLSRVDQLRGTIEEKSDQVVYFGITKDYRVVHQEYSLLARSNYEALKRGLFLIWYAKSEPTWLTGIGELDRRAEERIIKILDRRLKRDITDYELEWMLDYYSSWDFVFDEFRNFKNFHQRITGDSKTDYPEKIDKEEMERRGLMGIYWNSLKMFNKATSS